MKFFIEVRECEKMHPAYGFVKFNFATGIATGCLLPFNLILRPLYLLWMWIHYWPKITKLERDVKRVKEKAEAKEQGNG